MTFKALLATKDDERISTNLVELEDGRWKMEAWSRLTRDLDLNKLAQATQVVGLAEVSDVAKHILEAKIRGHQSCRCCQPVTT
jgi:hypothetical protein